MDRACHQGGRASRMRPVQQRRSRRGLLGAVLASRGWAMIRFNLIPYGKLREAYRQRGGDPYVGRVPAGFAVGSPAAYKPPRYRVVQGGKQ